MANSAREQILNALVTALQNIAAGSGYNFTIGLAQLGLLHFLQVPADKFPAACVCGADEDRKNVTNQHFHSDMKASIVGYVSVADGSHDADDTATLEKYVSRLIEDVTKAIMADPTLGGKARIIEIESIKTDKGSWKPQAGFEMVVRAEYRSTFMAP